MDDTFALQYILAPGTQVREENFGLLFYTMAGPRLYFLSSGQLLSSRFFGGECTLHQWIKRRSGEKSVPHAQIAGIMKSLRQLKEKGVIIEC